MRVISGKARGTSLYSLEGLHTRPTTDRVKESMFSIINFNIPDAVVLDLFSGSGALGIESISRGAQKCYFVENSAGILYVDESLEKATNMFNQYAEQYLKRVLENTKQPSMSDEIRSY